jgi:hypothetical protein
MFGVCISYALRQKLLHTSTCMQKQNGTFSISLELSLVVQFRRCH